MKNPPRFLEILAFLVSVFIFAFQAEAQEWREITPLELQQKTPKVDPAADAEAIFWEVRIDDTSTSELVMKHYVRVKIFTDRGREKFSKVDIPYVKGEKIREIMARVIRPDGSISEISKSDVFEREVLKADKFKVKSKSFAVPNIDVGVVVEYQYKEVIPGSSADNMRMVFQRDIPIQTSSYYFKPFSNGRVLMFNMPNGGFEKDKGGYQRMTLNNVPALKEEPQMPPEDEVRSWLLVYYTDTSLDVKDFWSYAGYWIVKAYDIKDTLKPGKELREATQQIVKGAATPEEQLNMIFDFCKTRVKNISYDPSISDEEMDKIKPNKSTWETYQKLSGRNLEINELFAAMATSLGLETRLAFGGDRSKMFFNPSRAHPSFIHFSSVAVRVGNEWKYFDPGSLFVTRGMLAWNEEATSVLLLGYKDYIKSTTPMSDYRSSSSNRSGSFKLTPDGTLEGTVKIEYTGHLGSVYKLDNYEASPAKREEDLKAEIKAQFAAAELSEIRIENVTDPEKPVVAQFKIKVPNYAQKTGKRLFLQPGFFTYGKPPRFTSSDRQYNIFFRYPWSENDEVEIALPEGFTLDNADQPSDVADPSRISSLQIRISKDGRLLKYNRRFFFGGGDTILFPKEVYGALKNLFDAFEKSESHTITLRQP